MATRRLEVPNKLASRLRSLHPGLKRRLKTVIRIILDDPDTGKSLKDELAGLHSFRVGRYRLIYRIHPDRITLVALGPRKSIYEETLRIRQREKP